jgi:chemotaxis protein histidine kinase CheA
MPDPFSIANSASADLIFLDFADTVSVATLVEQIRSLTTLFVGPAAAIAEQARVVLSTPGNEEDRRRKTADLLEYCLQLAESAAQAPAASESTEVVVDQPLVDFLERADELLARLTPRTDLAAYKRTLHGVKGDAGVVGLRDEAHCCHAMEEALARGLHPVHLDMAVKWLEESFSARRFGLAPPPCDSVLVSLRRTPPLGETLVATGLVRPDTVAAALAQQVHLTPGRPLGEILVDSGRVSPQALAEVLRVPVAPPLRIDAQRLQQLDAALARLQHHHRQSASSRPHRRRLVQAWEEVRLARESLQLTTAQALLERMARVAQDAARTLGLPLELTVSGAELAIDRHLADRIADPLQHLVRNAVSHGIEPAGERERGGKPSAGQVAIRVAHAAHSVRIEVADDGRGIDRQRICAKAGLPAGTALSDEELWKIISRPGFSTAASVSSLAGRGIGLDAVADLMVQLSGSISVHSVIGAGTTFTILLPPACS